MTEETTGQTRREILPYILSVTPDEDKFVKGFLDTPWNVLLGWEEGPDNNRWRQMTKVRVNAGKLFLVQNGGRVDYWEIHAWSRAADARHGRGYLLLLKGLREIYKRMIPVDADQPRRDLTMAELVEKLVSRLQVKEDEVDDAGGLTVGSTMTEQEEWENLEKLITRLGLDKP
ncbi:hypothetical protein BDW59DRAFT_165772 [Aspergillus cavernicola]|uniref:Uncharacterized protein n=1 Tax=Aspergillus cavernicola TaxID=176166 RepID=A0ABR4HSL0_9EURO